MSQIPPSLQGQVEDLLCALEQVAEARGAARVQPGNVVSISENKSIRPRVMTPATADKATPKDLHSEVAHPAHQGFIFLMIHDIPTEVLIPIIGMAAGFDISRCPRDYFRRLRVLGHVCVRWRKIVLETPQLWARMNLAHSKADREMALVLSRAWPLDLDMWSQCEAQFWSAVNSQMYRWKSMTMPLIFENLDGETGDLSALETGPAPALVSFQIKHIATSQSRGPVSLDLFQGVAPQLKHLHLGGVALRNWTSPSLLHGLQSLGLAQIGVVGPSFEQMLAILEASPHLKDLSLECMSFKGCLDSPRRVVRQLPILEKLKLSQLLPDEIATLLSVLDPRCCASIIIRSIGFRGRGSKLPDLITSFVKSSPLSSGTFGDTLRLDAVPRAEVTMSISSTSSSHPFVDSFHLSLANVSTPERLIRCILDTLDANPNHTPHKVCEIHLALDPLPQPIAMLRRLSSITELTLSDCSQSLDEIVQGLSVPLDSPGGTAGAFLCPNLHSITFINCRVPHPSPVALMMMVFRRVGAVAINALAVSGQSFERVAMLDTLMVYGGNIMDEETLIAIQDLMDGAHWAPDKRARVSRGRRR